MYKNSNSQQVRSYLSIFSIDPQNSEDTIAAYLAILILDQVNKSKSMTRDAVKKYCATIVKNPDNKLLRKTINLLLKHRLIIEQYKIIITARGKAEAADITPDKIQAIKNQFPEKIEEPILPNKSQNVFYRTKHSMYITTKQFFSSHRQETTSPTLEMNVQSNFDQQSYKQKPLYKIGSIELNGYKNSNSLVPYVANLLLSLIQNKTKKFTPEELETEFLIEFSNLNSKIIKNGIFLLNLLGLIVARKIKGSDESMYKMIELTRNGKKEADNLQEEELNKIRSYIRELPPEPTNENKPNELSGINLN